MISMLKALGQLKRKGKFDEQSEFMKPNHTSSKKKSDAASNNMQFENSSSRNILDDINGGVSGTSDVGGYTPTEIFPLEAKMIEPKYALEPASPSSDIEQYMQQQDPSSKAQPANEFNFDNPSNDE